MKKYIPFILLISFLVVTFMWKDDLSLQPEPQEEIKMFSRRINPDEYKVEEAPIKESKSNWYSSLKEELTAIIGLINLSLIVLERLKKVKGN